MAFPKIGYRSIIETAAALAATSSASGFPIANITGRRSWLQWKATSTAQQDIDIDMGAAATADYIAIAAGNLAAENSTLTLFADSFTPPTTSRATIAPADWPVSGIWIKEFGSLNLRYWRIRCSAAATNPVYLGDVRLGAILTFTEHLVATIDPNVEQAESALERADGGSALGATMRRVVKEFTIDIGAAGAEWTTLFSPTNMINDFWKNHARKYRTFFFHTNIDAPTFFEPLYLICQADAQFNRPLVGGRYSRRGFTLPVESAIAEAA